MVKFFLEFDEFILCILGKVVFLLRGFDRVYVDFCFVGVGGFIVFGKLGIKYGVVFFEKGVEVCFDGLG